MLSPKFFQPEFDFLLNITERYGGEGRVVGMWIKGEVGWWGRLWRVSIVIWYALFFTMRRDEATVLWRRTV